MTAKWVLHRPSIGFLAYSTVMLMYSDPIHVRNIEGCAVFDTRETANTVKAVLIKHNVPVNGYAVKRLNVLLQVAK